MKLRNRKSYMTSLPEGTPPTRRAPRITQWIYYLVLISILAYLGNLGIQQFVYFKGSGRVETEKTAISSSRGGRILELPLRIGQLVNAGDLLARIEAPVSCKSERDSRLEKIHYDMQIKQARLDLLRQQLANNNNTLSDTVMRRALELDRNHLGRLERLERERKEQQLQISLLSSELFLLGNRIENIKQQRAALQPGSECLPEEIIAPFAATITLISKKEQEYTQRGKPFIVLMQDNAPVRIDAYLSRDYLRYLHIDKELTVEFPDGQQSLGLVRKIESTAASFSTQEWDGYDPLPVRVKAVLKPVDKHAHVLWEKYDRMEVKLRGSRE